MRNRIFKFYFSVHMYLHLWIGCSGISQSLYTMWNDRIRVIGISSPPNIVISICWEPSNPLLTVILKCIANDYGQQLFLWYYIMYNRSTSSPAVLWHLLCTLSASFPIQFWDSSALYSLYLYVMNFFDFHKWVRAHGIFLSVPSLFCQT
jgi:hypothetical protein